jgi:hypothetical protein
MERFNDSVVQSRVDKRLLATASMWFAKTGRLPRTVSELVRYVVEDYVAILVSNERVELITESEQARQLLAELYGSRVFNPGGRGLRNEHSNLVLDDLDRKPNLVSNSPEYEKVNNSLLADIRRGRIGLPKDLEVAKRNELSKVKYEADGLSSSFFVGPKIEKPEDWGQVKNAPIDRDKLKDLEEEYIRKKAELLMETPEEIQDRKDSWTRRKMTDEEIRNKEKEDREKQKKFDEELLLANEEAKKNCVVFEEEK